MGSARWVIDVTLRMENRSSGNSVILFPIVTISITQTRHMAKTSSTVETLMQEEVEDWAHSVKVTQGRELSLGKDREVETILPISKR